MNIKEKQIKQESQIVEQNDDYSNITLPIAKENEIIGAAKLMDGLFLGDAFCGEPVEINDQLVKDIITFISEGLDQYEGVLIHSLNGKNRCSIAAIIFLMNRYRWGLIKCLEFLNQKKPGLEMTASLLKVLLDYEKTLENEQSNKLSTDWQTFYKEGTYYYEEKVLVYSYLNSINSEFVEIPSQQIKKKHSKTVTFDDKVIILNPQNTQEDQQQILLQQQLVTLQSQISAIQFLEQDSNNNITKINANDIKINRDVQMLQDDLIEDDDEYQPIILSHDVLYSKNNNDQTQQIQNTSGNTNQNNIIKENNILSNDQRNDKIDDKLIKIKGNDSTGKQQDYQDLIDIINQKGQNDNDYEAQFNQYRDDLHDSPKVKNKNTKNNQQSTHKGPYMNQMRASQEQLLRLSQHLKSQQNTNNHYQNEQKLTLNEITNKHNYLKRHNNKQDQFGNKAFESNAFRENNLTDRYNPLKIIGKDLIKDNKLQKYLNESDEELSVNDQNNDINKIKNQKKQNNVQFMIPTTFYQTDMKEDIQSNNNYITIKHNQKQDQLLNINTDLEKQRNSILNQINTKVDSMKIQVNQMKQQYIENLKEQSETRRTKFYANNIQTIFQNKQHHLHLQQLQIDKLSNKQLSLNSIQSPTLSINKDNNSIKSEKILHQGINNNNNFIISKNYESSLPSILLSRQIKTDPNNNNDNHNSTLFDESIDYKRKVKTRINFIEQNQTSTYQLSSIQGRSQSIALTILPRNQYLHNSQNNNKLPDIPLKSNNHSIIHTQRNNIIDDHFQQQQKRNKYQIDSNSNNFYSNQYQIKSRSPNISTLERTQNGVSNNIQNTSILNQQLQPYNHDNSIMSSNGIPKEDLINKYKFKGTNKVNQTAKQVIALSTEKRKYI